MSLSAGSKRNSAARMASRRAGSRASPSPAAAVSSAISVGSPEAPPSVHLPEGWHREHEWMNLFEAACGPPAAAA
jgi:hypothetical protein